MKVLVDKCDVCGRLASATVEMTTYNCGCVICSRHPMTKTERGEPFCERCRRPVYIVSIE